MLRYVVTVRPPFAGLVLWYAASTLSLCVGSAIVDDYSQCSIQMESWVVAKPA